MVFCSSQPIHHQRVNYRNQVRRKCDEEASPGATRVNPLISHRFFATLHINNPGKTTVSVHEHWMKLALREAARALEEDEVPVGAVVVHDGKVIGKGYNQIERLQDPTAHAEMIALTAASNHLSSRRLEGCALYVTLEPCPMCAGAIVLGRIPTLVFGAYDPKAGACGTLFNIPKDPRLNHQPMVIPGVLDRESEKLLKGFFGRVRSVNGGGKGNAS
jgi:tRNA(adenine34) deaminase